MSAPERFLVEPLILPDDVIEQWARIYEASHGLRPGAMSFEEFLVRASTALSDVRGIHEPLLPAQRRARDRADLQGALLAMTEREIERLSERAHCENGRWVETMRRNHRAKRKLPKRELTEISA